MSSHFSKELDRLWPDLEKALAEGPLLLALEGPLGAGKTTFTQELLARLGVKQGVQSPTFLKLLEYALPQGGLCLHMDAYRIEADEADEEFEKMALETYSESARLWIVEWPELFLEFLRKNPTLCSTLGLKDPKTLVISRSSAVWGKTPQG